LASCGTNVPPIGSEQQVGDNGGRQVLAIQHGASAVAAWTQIVNRPRKRLLAATPFADDQHRHRHLTGQPDLLPEASPVLQCTSPGIDSKTLDAALPQIDELLGQGLVSNELDGRYRPNSADDEIAALLAFLQQREKLDFPPARNASLRRLTGKHAANTS